MGTSFVEIGEKGFWVQDSLLCLWLRLLALNIESKTDGAHPVTVLRDHWLVQSEILGVGTVDAGLGKIAANPEAILAVRQATERLLNGLGAHAEAIDFNTLNLLGMQGVHWQAYLDSTRLSELGRAFLDLLEGKIDTGAGDEAHSPGLMS